MVETIPDLFYTGVDRDLPVALARRVDGGFKSISHRELQAQVERLALALEGRLERGDRLAILAENRPEWAIADYACALSGLVSVPIYATLNQPQTGFILRHCRARWVVCSTPEQLAKVIALWPELPYLDGAVLVDGPAPDAPPDPQRPVLAWRTLLDEGAAQEARRPEIRERARQARPQDLLTIIYTSGTTGDPKGAMLSHGNVVSNVVEGLKVLRPEPGERILSILPLSHIFERTCGHYMMLYAGVGIFYAENLQTIPRDLQEVRPHVLLAVPRIYEKSYARIREQVNAGGYPSRLAFHLAMLAGRRVVQYRYRERRPDWGLRLAMALWDRLLFRKVRERFGGRIRMAACGGAPVNPAILEFFWAAGIPIFEGYGLTETSPIITLCAQGEMRPGYVGRPIMDLWQGKPFLALAEDGEILCRGPNVMLGYWENEKATREALDERGYFHTGDIGELDPQGRLRITDRKKEILVTSGGKNIAPQPLENALRGDRYIEQAVVIGDRRHFVSAILVPNFAELRRWAQHRRLSFITDAELVALPETMDKIMRRVQRINENFSNFEHIKKVILLDRELTADSGLLTPSLKVRRRAVDEAFAARIAKLYEEPAGN
ncbi:MAG: long-chain fatty acid--CoA ligase [Holophaga sp.]|nr:long-chain fatty acid--CoA ligase [Holophaga sp.]